MHRKIAAGLTAFVAVAVATAGSARAEIIGGYVSGYGSMSGETDALMSGGSTTGVGGGVGLRGGLHLGPFSGYVDRTTFFRGSSALRAIFAFGGDIPIGPFNLVLELGGGGVWENKGGVDGDMTQGKRQGLVGRGTIGIELPMAKHVALGLSFEDEYYAVHDPSAPVTMPSDVITGSDFLSTLYVKVAFGI